MLLLSGFNCLLSLLTITLAIVKDLLQRLFSTASKPEVSAFGRYPQHLRSEEVTALHRVYQVGQVHIACRVTQNLNVHAWS